jgi:hypothetical protein
MLLMISYNQAEMTAEQRLHDAEFSDLTLDMLPATREVADLRHTAVPYAMMGNPDASHIIVHPTPYFTR